MIRIATAAITGISPYSASAPYRSEKTREESYDEFEARCWREHLTVGEDGKVVISFMAFKMALTGAAKLTQRKLKGSQTYSKSMETGVLLDAPLALGIDPANVKSERFYVNADGVRGSGKRVWRTFPMIFPWAGTLRIHVMNPAIAKDVFEEYLREAGMYIGVGRFRPEKGGVNGRWSVGSVKWS